MENRNFVGIIRHMDDLGRVVIPKDIRRGMGIAEGEAIEIFATDAQEIVLRRAIVQEKDGILVKVDAHCTTPPTVEPHCTTPPTAEPIECYFENDYGQTEDILLRITPEQNKLLNFLRENDLLHPDFSLRDGLPELDINDLTK